MSEPSPRRPDAQRRLRSARIQFAVTVAAILMALVAVTVRVASSSSDEAQAAEPTSGATPTLQAVPSPSTESPTPSPTAPARPSASPSQSASSTSASPGQSASTTDLPDVSEGDSGAVVNVIQEAFGMKPTGYFGPATRAQVETFQADLGIPATGTVGELTWSALGEETRAAAAQAYGETDGFVDGEPPVSSDAPAETTAEAQPSDTASEATADPSSEPSQRGSATKPPVLEETDSGEAVAVLQRALGVKPASGYFGPVTTKAVQRFQESVGLPTTGVVATYTWRSLGPELAAKVAQADATYGTDFGPGIPDKPASSGGGGHSGGGNSGGGNSGGGNSGGGSQSVSGRFCPVNSFSYGDGMGADRGDHSHQGLDLMGSRGEPIYAIDSGTVTREEWQANGALVLDITGDNGMFFYGHFDSITVSYGEYVHAGQVIGYMGDTGSPGAVHLHLEDRPYGWSGNAVDPVPLVHKLCD